MSQNSNATKFVRGGQTTQHWFRMAGQVFTTFLGVSLGVYGVVLIVLLLLAYDIPDLRLAITDNLVTTIYAPTGKFDTLVLVHGIRDAAYNITVREYLADPIIAERVQEITKRGYSLLVIAALPSIISGILCAYLYYRAGRFLGDSQHERGSRLISQAELGQWVDRKWTTFTKRLPDVDPGPRYSLAGIPFPPNTVQAQTSLTGTVGTGKTTVMIEVLQTIRENDGRSIIYDRMGTLVERFYDPSRGDIIINPFDARSVSWSPFYEAKDVASFAQIAEVLIPQNAGSNDQFWEVTARLVFEYVARGLLKEGRATNTDLREAISIIDDEKLIELVSETPAATVLNDKSPKTAQSIRANLVSQLRFLEFLRDDAQPFSIREWVKQDKPGFIFLTGDSEHAAATRPVISACVEVASNALMTTGQSKKPELFFLLDELPTLNRLPFLEKSLAEIRQFGGAYVLGFQVKAQLEAVYGDKGAQTISGVLNNRVVFNTPDPDTADFAARSLGKEDITDQRQNMSMGADSARDGVGYTDVRTERDIVTASEIQNLPQLVGYVRFGYDAPTALVRFAHISKPPIAQSFIPYEGTGFAIGSLESPSSILIEQSKTFSVHRVPSIELNVDEQIQFFENWKNKQHDSDNNAPIDAARYCSYNDEADFDEDLYYEQKSLWNHVFMCFLMGQNSEAIKDSHLCSLYTADALKAALPDLPPFPFEHPSVETALDGTRHNPITGEVLDDEPISHNVLSESKSIPEITNVPVAASITGVFFEPDLFD